MSSRQHPRTVAVVGATGFCGRPIAERCRILGFDVRAVSRTPMPAAEPASHHHGAHIPVAADVRDPATLAAALDGCDRIVHAASYTGTDPLQAWSVNAGGTQNLVAAAAHLGIDDVVYLSTIGVYGSGPFRQRREDPRPSPVTELSRSRLAAEDVVRAAGGTVLRPGFTYGPGPQSFLTGLARIVTTFDALIEHGSVPQSVLSVAQLAAVTAELVARPIPATLRGQALNVADPEPRTIGQLVGDARTAGFLAPPRERLSLEQAQDRARTTGLSARELDLVATEHTLDITRLQRLYPDVLRRAT